VRKDKFKFLKLLNEYRSIDYELQYVKEHLGDVHLEFEVFYRTWCANNGVDLDELNKRNQRKVDMIFLNEKSHDIKQGLMLESFKEDKSDSVKGIKHVYKSVARKLHPDLLDSSDPRFEEYENDFKKASSANEEGRWGELFDIVDKHGISLKSYKEAIECLRFDIKRVKEDLEKEKSTYSWLYSEAESAEQRVGIVKRFLKHLYGWSG
jgi:hypothetical protein